MAIEFEKGIINTAPYGGGVVPGVIPWAVDSDYPPLQHWNIS